MGTTLSSDGKSNEDGYDDDDDDDDEERLPFEMEAAASSSTDNVMASMISIMLCNTYRYHHCLFEAMVVRSGC